jgi:outer membrane protein
MRNATTRQLLAILLVFSASDAYAATQLATRPLKFTKNNEVSVDLPEEAPVVTPVLEPKPPEARPELLGSTAEPVVLKGAEYDERPVTKAEEKPTKEDTNTLRDALAYVYEHHPQLLAEREKLKSIDESVSQAVSDFRPDIYADYGKGRERRSSNNAPWSYGDTSTKGLTLTQPLFSGGESVASLKSAKQRMKAARADLVAVEQQVLFNALVAYTGVVEAQSVLLLNQNNVDVLRKQKEAAQVRFDVGELTKTDVSQAEARYAGAKAAEQQALGDLSIARANFMRAVGYPAPDTIAMPEVPANLPKTIEEATKQAHAASPVITAARHREKAFASDVNARAGAVLPDVNIETGLRRSNGGSVFSNQDSDSIMLNVSIPLYQGGAEWSRIREARNTASQAKYNTIDTTFAVEQDVTNAWQNYTTTDSVIISTEAAAKASELALEGVRQENEFGVRTVLDVLDAEQEYLNTKVNLVRAIRNHKIQAYRLLASVGKLTADELSLPVKIYDPSVNYDNVKYQLLGL